MSSDALHRTLGRLLDRICRAWRQQGDAAEAAIEAVRAELSQLPRAGLLEALQTAGAGSAKRQAALPFALAELADVPGVADALLRMYYTVGADARHWIVQTIANRKLYRFAPYLSEMFDRESDEVVRECIIVAMGRLADAVSLRKLLDIAAERGVNGAVIRALADLRREECRALLQAAFDECTEQIHQPVARANDQASEFQENQKRQMAKTHQVIAAWGLAKLGDRSRLAFLGETLYDLPTGTPNSCDPGLSMRAAQAIADCFGLEFDWSAQSVARIRRWWESGGRNCEGGQPVR